MPKNGYNASGFAHASYFFPIKSFVLTFSLSSSYRFQEREAKLDFARTWRNREC